MPTSTFKAHDGLELFYREWPIDNPKAHVAIIHGYGEHIGRYDRLAQELNAMGFSLSGYDHRNHGNSPGLRGYINRFDELVEDAAIFVNREKNAKPDIPCFILGHSMGGLCLCRLLQKHEMLVSGTIFSSPFLQIGSDISPALIAVGRLLSVIAPKLPVVDLEPQKISRVKEEVEAYVNDPLVFHGRIVARTGAELNMAVSDARMDMHKIALPAYIIHGTQDQLAPHAGANYLFDHITSMDKTLQQYDGAFHELFNDYGREKVIAEMVEWITIQR